MEELNDLIPIPPKEWMNKRLSSATEATMLKVLGNPGKLTQTCSDPTGNIVSKLAYNVDVGPFKVSGLSYAVESLKQIFSQVKEDFPLVYDAVKTSGVLCVRSRRQNPLKYSNHSWGTAIDLYFGHKSVPQGVPQTQRGVYMLYPYFNNHGWYWGAEFSGDSVDAMHFEVAEETMRKLESLQQFRFDQLV